MYYRAAVLQIRYPSEVERNIANRVRSCQIGDPRNSSTRSTPCRRRHGRGQEIPRTYLPPSQHAASQSVRLPSSLQLAWPNINSRMRHAAADTAFVPPKSEQCVRDARKAKRRKDRGGTTGVPLSSHLVTHSLTPLISIRNLSAAATIVPLQQVAQPTRWTDGLLPLSNLQR